MRNARALLVLLGALIVAAPGLAEARHGHRDHGHHGYKHKVHHGYKHGYHHGHGHHHRKHYRHHRGAHFSLWLGPLWWGPRPYPVYAHPYPYPYPYHHETTVIVQEPPVYVERPARDAAAGSWWYWCQSAEAYYPEVGSCPEGWQKVAPRPE